MLNVFLGKAFSHGDHIDGHIWELKIETTENRYSDLKKVRLFILIKNKSEKAEQLILPDGEESSWPQFIRVYKDGQRMTGGADIDYAALPTQLKPGQSVSFLVGLDKFIKVADRKGDHIFGKYILEWKGSTVGNATDAKADFSISPDAKDSSRYSSAEYYENRFRSTDRTIIKDRLWHELTEESPVMEVLLVLEKIPPDLLEAKKLLDLVKVRQDVGIKRASVQKMHEILTKDKAFSVVFNEEEILALLKIEKDPILQKLLLKCLYFVRDTKLD